MMRILILSFMIFLTACAGGKKPVTAPSAATTASEVKAAIKSGNTAKSVELAEKAYKATPDDAAAALNYATALRMAGREAQAKTILKKFADKPGASADILNEFSRIALSEGQYKRALASALNATQLYGEDAEASNILGMAYDANNQLKPAEAAYRKALELSPKSKAAVLNNLALNLTLQEKLDKALPMIEEALALEPSRREYKRNRAMIRAMHTQVYHTVE